MKPVSLFVVAVLLLGSTYAQDPAPTEPEPTPETISQPSGDGSGEDDDTPQPGDAFSPKASFYKMSADLNSWSDTGKVGAVLGFGVFGLAYMYTVVAIFMSIS